MTRSIAMVLMFAAVTSAATPCDANAQLGGLIKKKIKETIKPPEKPAEPAPAPAAGKSTGAAATATSGSGLPAISGDVLVISPETIERVMRGMDSEAALVADFRKILAKYPTTQQYQECKSKAVQTPEGQKIAMGIMNIPDNATPEQRQAAVTKINMDVQALEKRKCPYDPYDWNDNKRSERMEQIHVKAASMARAKPVSSTASGHEVGQKHLLFEVNPFEALPDTVIDTVAVINGGGLSDSEYSILIERMVKYCDAKKIMDMSPDKGDLKLPGTGKGMYWIYKKEELEALKQLNCDAFMKKWASIYGPYAQ